jgi:hypothetical protein
MPGNRHPQMNGRHPPRSVRIECGGYKIRLTEGSGRLLFSLFYFFLFRVGCKNAVRTDDRAGDPVFGNSLFHPEQDLM